VLGLRAGNEGEDRDRVVAADEQLLIVGEGEGIWLFGEGWELEDGAVCGGAHGV
jgi:hypothetical protein